MAETAKPVLQKPPGYRDPNTPVPSVRRPPPIRKLPPSFHPKTRNRGCRRFCCCFLCIFVFTALVLVALAGALFYLWFQPKLPTFYLRSFQMPRFNVSVMIDGTYLDSQTVVRFETTNPNHKITFYYGESQVRVTVGEEDGVDLGSTFVPAFTQGRRNTTVLKFGTQVKHMLIDDGDGTKLKAGFQSKQLVIFVEVRTKVGLGVQRWRMGMLSVKVLCGDVSLKKLEDGAMPRCDVNLLKWINLHS
ncbi:PREDICTED: uncharacterized protein LOC104593414 [Nelumbo nucifera]|uniref:Uncharacterized protein LOC104593414 n=2 Tax=Nelumbo nucifera TaxID=4432 RepID=A0A1U7ZF80_NELNU|nr:PREDICTED: uncharacterized protein LOC104593414 [Nelumbo nucifera]XP_010251539.1 PREDICTED: uncharacterized protein LOC104593414 [Nelumbo nucifera]XP_010251540.1 PREDICTED: uncharacterized protein LOC104593414 [Nelumbo nucifera]DAD43282.1 TPA_asm: hypothetical protein HUJ06_001512 [Nelumbo nucifera]